MQAGVHRGERRGEHRDKKKKQKKASMCILEEQEW